MTHEYTEAGLYDVIVSESIHLTDRAASLEQFERTGRRYYVVLCDMLVKVAWKGRWTLRQETGYNS